LIDGMPVDMEVSAKTAAASLLFMS